jgi:hypothetical protein
MAWIYHDGRPYCIASLDAKYEEPAPMMFREPPYYDDGYYRSNFRDQCPVISHGGYLIPREQVLVRAEDPPLTFREPPYFDDGYYRSNFRDQYPVFSHGGYLIPREQVLVRAEDPPPSWWHNSGYPYAGCVVERPKPVTTVELYAPQLCCDECERRVMACLDDMAGVDKVIADQWEKKVVVVGHNLCPNDVLRRLQRDPHMNRSVFWHDR